jgi:AcrR family transcriptional regulator
MTVFLTEQKLCKKEGWNMAEITKLWIADKMRELMKYKTIDKIRVTEICKAAEIERPTFYYHFKDKYDLVAWMFYHSAYETDVISVESAAQSMNKMKSDMIFYKRAYEDSSQNALWRYMLEYFVKRYTELAKEKLRTDLLDTQLSYSIRFYCMGAVGMTQEWVLNDNITSAETVVQMMFASMPENMRSVFFPEQ